MNIYFLIIKKGRSICTKLSVAVVNVVAERGVKLIEEEYSNILTKDEDQRQFLLQVVSDHRKRYPDCKKQTLSKK